MPMTQRAIISRFMPLFTLLAVVLLAGCSAPQVRHDRNLLGNDIITLDQHKEVAATIIRIVQQPTFVELDLDLVNTTSETTLLLKGLGASSPFFSLQWDQQRVSAEARPGAMSLYSGYHEGRVSTTKTGLELAPGARAGLVLRFRWDEPIPSSDDYPWTLHLGGIYELGSGTALPTMLYRHTP